MMTMNAEDKLDNDDIYSEPMEGPDQVLPASSHKCWSPDGCVALQLSDVGPSSEPPTSVYSLMKGVAELYPQQPALAVKRDGQWRYTNYQEYFDLSCTVARAFIKLGLERFHGVCIMGFNSPEWLIANFGAIFAGGLSAGVYTTNSQEACKHLALDSRAQIIVVENDVCLQKFMTVKNELPSVKIYIQWSGTPTAEGVMTWQELLDLGKSESDDGLQHRLKLQAMNQCCSLIYTSGTTGLPKGVMCSQDNLTWTGRQQAKRVEGTVCSEAVISYLPLSHLAAQMTDIYMTLPLACTVFFAQPDALKGTLGITLREAQPTAFFGVPRIWEKMYEKMQEASKKVTGVKRVVATWAKNQALNYHVALREGRELSSFERLQYHLASSYVLQQIKSVLGFNRCHKYVSGSAPISKDVLDYFMSVDMPIIEGYGLSESLSACSMNEICEGGFKHGTVGRVVDFTSVKLVSSTMVNSEEDTHGEIAMKGRNICMGYLNMQDKTNETILDNGWMMTGDLGWFDEDQFLYITGRVKELVITAGGENIPPVFIETCIKKRLPILSNAMVVGDKRKYLTILLTIKCETDQDGAPLDTLDPSVLQYVSDRGSAATTVRQLREEVDSNRQGVLATDIQRAIDSYNSNDAISNAQRVQRWTILPRDFSQATGELNNTLKLKRSVTATMYADTIDALYSEQYPR